MTNNQLNNTAIITFATYARKNKHIALAYFRENQLYLYAKQLEESMSNKISNYANNTNYTNNINNIAHQSNNDKEMIVHEINNIIKQHSLRYEEITHVITISGPGSFIGLRLSATLASAMFNFLDVSHITISTFEIFLHLALLSSYQSYTQVNIDAHTRQYGRAIIFFTANARDIYLIGVDIDLLHMQYNSIHKSNVAQMIVDQDYLLACCFIAPCIVGQEKYSSIINSHDYNIIICPKSIQDHCIGHYVLSSKQSEAAISQEPRQDNQPKIILIDEHDIASCATTLFLKYKQFFEFVCKNSIHREHIRYISKSGF